MLETLIPEQTFFSISEVSQLTGVKPYIIRYWESQFGILRPARRTSGQRKFIQKDVDTIQKIKELLYEKRFTISGAKRFLKSEGRRGAAQLRLDLGETGPSASKTLDILRNARKDLEEAIRLLKLE